MTAGRAAVKLDYVRMVLGLAEHARDDPPLSRHPEAAGAAGALDGVRAAPG